MVKHACTPEDIEIPPTSARCGFINKRVTAATGPLAVRMPRHAIRRCGTSNESGWRYCPVRYSGMVAGLNEASV